MLERDPQLVRRTLAGDATLSAHWWSATAVWCTGCCLEVVRRPDEVEDLSQEVFCRAYEELTNLRQPEMFSPWLCRIATRMGVDWLRQRKVERQAALVGLGRVVSVDLRPPDEMLETRETEGWRNCDAGSGPCTSAGAGFRAAGCAGGGGAALRVRRETGATLLCERR